MKNGCLVVLLAALLCGPAMARPAAADTATDMDKVATYADLLGRGIGCGFGMKEQTRRVGAWIDKTFAGPDVGKARKLFVTSMQQGAKEQSRSEESCARLRSTLDEITWP